MPLSARLQLLLTIPLLALGACGTHAAADAPGPSAPPPPAVGVEPVERRDVVEHIELTGRLGPVDSVEVRPRVSGHLLEVCFAAGDLVEKGQVLFKIDARWHQAELERRAAELEGADARVAVAEHENERAGKLVETKAISGEEAEARGSKLREARAADAMARAQHSSAALDLEYTTIRSPIRGRISRALVTAGNFVSGIPAANTLLATIVSIDPLYVYADLDEASFLRFDQLRRGHAGTDNPAPIAVEIGLAGEQGFPRPGRLESLDNQVEAGTGTMLLRALLDNRDLTLVPGLFVRVRVPLGASEPALLVDERAIGTDQNQKFVLALGEGDVAEYRKVTLGQRLGDRRVIREGLHAGDRVIVTGLQKARPGMPVAPGPVAVAGR